MLTIIILFNGTGKYKDMVKMLCIALLFDLCYILPML